MHSVISQAQHMAASNHHRHHHRHWNECVVLLGPTVGHSPDCCLQASPGWWWGLRWLWWRRSLWTAGFASPRERDCESSPLAESPALSSNSVQKDKKGWSAKWPALTRILLMFPLLTLTRWAMRAGDLKTIHWSTATVSCSPSFWIVMSPPKNSRENGDTSVQSYRKIWGHTEGCR